MGIPYAAPPVNELRFKGPQPVEPWYHKILYAQKEAPACSQANFFDPTPKYEGQEDCLYLNVYTPFVSFH
jgi:para-nitrobenzyl esterase